ncbi:biosynthetic-type acetolactate synthase large subunit [Desulfoferrobacter suflitae]|uniref:biosynthetic-type acetolactate synthase large subunit n=1 Tax=Desulfoferrobacter suflitae TaxID=2865782 RepID=UPI002164320F|nr:biosynthetic-type acetolactate synthase large subunit [Desulfoferrobacter suflitae]MCK8601720.1 biosynthetic-type acetolactate synthase large subunit [Desulfoferrobacter suflitae]
MKLKGAQIFFECLQKEGVEVIFGFPGGAVIDIYHELPKYDIRHILVRHEQGAAHMADGYARATGKVGVCLVTSGPGATNTVTGIATAYMDSVPMVIFTGQVPTALIGNDAFQEVDIVGISRPCTKHNYLVKHVDDLATVIKEAFFLARTGRPGPVLVDLPKDVLGAQIEFRYPKKVELKGYRPTLDAHLGQIKRAHQAIKKSKRPVIYAGGGVIIAEAGEELARFAELIQAPVTTTLMGLGSFPAMLEDPTGRKELNPWWLGMLGMHGTFRANMAVSNADLLIAVGARFDDRVTGKVSGFAPKAKIIHVDVDPTSISKNVVVDIPIVGDCKNALQKLIQVCEKEPLEDIEQARSAWMEQIRQWRETYPLAYKQEGDIIKPQYVVEKLYELCNGNAIVTTEVGQNQMWAAQYFHFNKPRTLLTSGGLGTMGYGLPAAIGAQVAFPDRLVIDIAGDGSIQMNIQELITAVCNCLPVKVAILNNRYLGMVRQWQELFYDKNYCATCLDAAPDFVKLADAYGAVGLRATRAEEVEPVIREAFSIKKPVLMEFVVAQEEGVYPMVPAGKNISEMLLV